jgi:hypothetical protein
MSLAVESTSPMTIYHQPRSRRQVAETLRAITEGLDNDLHPPRETTLQRDSKLRTAREVIDALLKLADDIIERKP